MRCLFKTTVLLLIVISIVCFSCATCPPGSDYKNVMKWEKKHKFRSAKYIKNHNADSCQIAAMMSKARKF